MIADRTDELRIAPDPALDTWEAREPDGDAAGQAARGEHPSLDDAGLQGTRRTRAALAMWLAIGLTTLDGSMTSVALPVIARDLHAAPAASLWVVNAYQVAITMALLPLGALGERLGYRRVYQAGLLVFALASLACALAPGLASLTAARFVQGLGAAGVMSVNGAIVRFIYPRPLLGRGIGYNALVVALASASGPSVAALVLSAARWPWLFAINVPIGLASLIVGWSNLPTRGGASDRFPGTDAALCAIGMGLLALGVTDLLHQAHAPRAAAEIAAGLVALILLARRSLRQRFPVLPLDLFRNRRLRLAYAASSLTFAAHMMAMLILPFYLILHFGFGPTTVGLILTPWALAVAAGAFASGRLASETALDRLAILGLVTLAGGLLAFATLSDSTPHWVLAACGLVCGAGFGLFQTPNNRTMLASGPADRSGAAAGMQATARLAGQTSGAAFVALAFGMLGPQSRFSLVAAALIATGAAAVAWLKLGQSATAIDCYSPNALAHAGSHAKGERK